MEPSGHLSGMDTSARRRFLIILIGTLTIAVLLVGVGVYGLIRGPAPATTPDAPAAGTTPVPSHSVPTLPATLAPSTDPVRYAREIADALFAWDTTTGHTRSDYLAALAGEAAPDGEEGNGLVADLNGYYPTVEQWRRLLEYQTRQHLVIDTAVIPDSWPQIVASAGDKLAPGTVAITIRGDRHRSGFWAGETAESVHKVAFTVFVLCPSDGDRCHLLRLSANGTPLE